MHTLLNLSDAVSLAFHTMGVLAEKEEGYLRTQEIADMLEVSVHHLQKVHQRLAKMGFITAVRGPKGGFRLNKPPDDITLLDIYEAIEGPLVPHECLLGRATCSRSECILGSLSSQVNKLVTDHFKSVTVSRLLSGKKPSQKHHTIS